MANFGPFGSAKAAVIGFIVEHLERESISENGPRLYRIEQEFSLFLQRGQVPELTANDIAATQRGFVWERIRGQIERWRAQGLMPPYIEHPDVEDTLVTWRHAGYEGISGSPPLGQNFFEVYRWLEALRGNEFILACACYLRAIECDPIFVTDGGGDEGIDCIGLMKSGALRGTVLLVQAKSSTALLSTEELLQEFGKSIGMRRTLRYMDYLRALGVHSARSGSADLYVLISNGDLKQGSIEAAPKLGALIRSRRQLAHVLSDRYTVDELRRFASNRTFPLTSDLTLNVASMLAPACV